MAVKPRQLDVLDTLKTAVVNAVAGAGDTTPLQTTPGLPIENQLVQILNAGGAQITLFPHGRREATRFSAVEPFMVSENPDVPLEVEVGTNTLTFSGDAAGLVLNVHTFVGAPVRDAFYQTGPTDSPSTVATGVAAAIDALGISGLSATASGAVVTVTGTPMLACNIGSSNVQAMAYEIGRYEQIIQVSVWADDPIVRATIAEAIALQVGQQDSYLFTLSDGSTLKVLFASDSASGKEQFDDSASPSYALFQQHLMFSVEYGLNKYVPAATIGSVEAEITVNHLSPTTVVTGGN